MVLTFRPKHTPAKQPAPLIVNNFDRVLRKDGEIQAVRTLNHWSREGKPFTLDNRKIEPAQRKWIPKKAS